MRKKTTKMEAKEMNPSKLIKVWIDDKTIVMVKDQSAFELWLALFPNAKIIQ
jgi:TusA-related sulfurtransferase